MDQDIDRSTEIDMRIQTIQSEVHELGLVAAFMTDEQVDQLARAALAAANIGLARTATPGHIDHLHHPADGADGRDGHAS